MQGIPEDIQQEQTQARATPTAPQAESTPAAPAATEATGGEEPVNLFEAAAQAGQGGTAGRGAQAAGAGAGAGEAGTLGNLDFLRNNPHFQQLRQLVQQQPQMLEPILQQVGAGNPQLAQLIGQNQEQFLQLLAEDMGDEAELPPGAHEIRVTEEERDAIERVCPYFYPLPTIDRQLLTTLQALPPWFFARLSDSGILCLRQERGISGEFPLRATRRGR